MTTHRLDTKTHHCGLPDESRDVLKLYIDTGPFVDFRRSLKRYFMVSPQHPLCKFYINSITALKKEEWRHLYAHYYMIHPLSMFNFWFKFCQAINLGHEYFFWHIIAPYCAPWLLQVIFSVSNIFYFMLIIVSFFMGHYNKQRNVVILDFRKVALKYLTTHFIFDLVAFSPVILRFKLIIHTEWDLDWSIIRILRWTLPLFKYVRYFYFLEAVEEAKLYFEINHYLYLATKTCLNFTMFLLFINTAIFVVLREFKHFEGKREIEYAQSSAQMFLMVAHGHHYTDHIIDKITPIVCICTGFILHLLLHVHIMQIWYQYYSVENKQISVYNSLGAFMRFRALPMKMRKRIFLYLDFKYQKHYYKDTSIKLATSPLLMQEMLIKISKETTDQVEIFKKTPEIVLEKIRACLVPVIFLPGDIIIKEGSRGQNMFFILTGTVKVVTSDGREISCLRDGGHFGEISLVLNLPRVANVIAETPCELYRLNRKHFMEVLKNYPEMLGHMISLATERITRLQDITTLDDHKSQNVSVHLGNDHDE